MIIGVSGKIGSGKDTVGKIIQYLTDIDTDSDSTTYEEYLQTLVFDAPKWEIKKFAGKVKQIISLLTGISVQALEKEEVKNRKLPDEWIRYGYADGFKHIHEDGVKTTVMINKQCDKERYELELKTNWQTAYKTHLTYRELLQIVGTDLFRNKFHEDTWINALFVDYKAWGQYEYSEMYLKEHPNSKGTELMFPNWVITDLRFPNEAKAIKDRDGIIIRINRPIVKDDGRWSKYKHVMLQTKHNHSSETSLDDYNFDYTIDNNTTIEELVEKVKVILKDIKLI
jgi:hypothetical protein